MRPVKHTLWLLLALAVLAALAPRDAVYRILWPDLIELQMQNIHQH